MIKKLLPWSSGELLKRQKSTNHNRKIKKLDYSSLKWKSSKDTIKEWKHKPEIGRRYFQYVLLKKHY